VSSTLGGLNMISVTISDEVKAEFKELSLGIAIVEDVKVKTKCEDLSAKIKEIEDKVRSNFRLEDLKDLPIIRAYRDFYWKIKIDPTKQRPSAEALIRRILRGRSIPKINCAVDAYNLISILTHISIGAYDLDKIAGPLTLRWSRDEEKFKGIGEEEKQIKRQLVIADSEKIINLYPHRDSNFTKITKETKRILIIACGAPRIPSNLVLEAAEKAAKSIVEFCGGKIVKCWLVK